MSRALLAAAAATAALAGCGAADDGDLPAERADRLAATLRELARATTGEDCALAQQFLGRAERRVADLPADVDESIVARLQEGLDRLRTQVPRECLPEQDPQAAPPTTTAPQETVPPQTTAPEEQAEPPAETTATTGPPPETEVPTTPTDPPPGEQQPGAGGSGGAGAQGEVE